MKQSDIKIGSTYTNGKGGVRKVIAMGPEYKLYNSQLNVLCLRYIQLAKTKGVNVVGNAYNCTVVSFASWAKEEVK